MRPIGVFDSGVGGLTVVKELFRHLPGEDIIYFGDTARVPYGIKSRETVIRFSIENILFLLKHDVKLICVACNTVSSVALPSIKGHFRVPIVGVIAPGVREAVYATRNKRIGVIGTRGTIDSRAYDKEIKQLDPAIKVTAAACPLFVPFAEEGWLEGSEISSVAAKYLKPVKDAKVDTVILGCTHYPLLKPVIKKSLGDDVALIDSAKQVAIEVKKILAQEGALNNKSREGRHKFYVSDNTSWFGSVAGRFLGSPLLDVEKVNNV
ncbi:MAG: glutamate racemase [Candidatus Omnitrophica bacterium]|nr:glutamate racemase [Candidatus Omnitrophota bacterium]MDD5553583.1 glutamate racemase [Candidatus Omnitrophota bacterium]